MGTYGRSCKERIVKKQKKTGRRFVQRVPVQRLEGIGMSLPDEVKRPTATRQPESVAVLTCPLCGAKRNVDQSFFDFTAEAKQVAMGGLQVWYKPQGAEDIRLHRASHLLDDYIREILP